MVGGGGVCSVDERGHAMIEEEPLQAGANAIFRTTSWLSLATAL
jgi:hypothetical protein